MTSPQTGGCLCGQVRYEAAEAPKFTIQCYCRDCQHISGGGSAPQLAVARDSATLSGSLKTFRVTSDAGNDVELGFCGVCGSPICKTTTAAPALIFFFAGSLGDPAMFSVGTKVYEDRRQPWDES